VLWFETTKAVPGTLAGLMRKVIKSEAGITTDVLFRQKDDADADDSKKPPSRVESNPGPSVVELRGQDRCRVEEPLQISNPLRGVPRAWEAARARLIPPAIPRPPQS
jgi:hypothetical protein